MTLYKYYLMERPPGLWCQPGTGLLETKDYGHKRDDCMGGMVRAWGWALYDRHLDMREIRDYELAYGGEVER